MKRISAHIICFVFGLSFRIILIAQPTYNLEKLNFCDPELDEFSPAYFEDGIVFCSDRKNNFWVTYTDTSEDSRQLYDLYFTKPIKEGKKWKSPEPLNGLNTLFQEGPACFYNGNNNVVYTRNLYTQKKFGNYYKSGNTLGLFFAERINNGWTNIISFPYNSEEYNIMHPAITDDGKTLYFSSDMPEGFGGFDIYVSYYRHGKWTKPVNLGLNINSNKDEVFPFIHSSGRLFFSSKGWNSRGGFDIFYSQQVQGAWIKPQNMKEPFSSTADDFGLIIDKYLQSGYFSSSRNKNDDIFAFKSAITEFENCTQQKENKYCYVFYENGTSEGDVKGTMKYEWDFGDGTKVRAVEAEHCYEKKGKYIVQLNVIDSLTNEIQLNQATYELEVDDYEQPYINAPDFGIIGQTINFDAKQTYLKNVRVAKYYWEFGDGMKSIGETVNHVFYNEGVYDVKLQVETTPGRTGVKKYCVYRTISISNQ